MAQFIFKAANDKGVDTLRLVRQGLKTETRRALRKRQVIGVKTLSHGHDVIAHFTTSKKGRRTAMRSEGNLYSYTDGYGKPGLGKLLVQHIWREDVRCISQKSVVAEGWESKGHYLGTLVQFHLPPLARLCLIHNDPGKGNHPQKVAFAFANLWYDVVTMRMWTYEDQKAQTFYEYVHSMPIEMWTVAAYRFIEVIKWRQPLPTPVREEIAISTPDTYLKPLRTD